MQASVGLGIFVTSAGGRKVHIGLIQLLNLKRMLTSRTQDPQDDHGHAKLDVPSSLNTKILNPNLGSRAQGSGFRFWGFRSPKKLKP